MVMPESAGMHVLPAVIGGPVRGHNTPGGKGPHFDHAVGGGKPPVSAHKCVRDQKARPQRPGEQLGEGGEHRPVGPSPAWA